MKLPNKEASNDFQKALEFVVFIYGYFFIRILYADLNFRAPVTPFIKINDLNFFFSKRTII